MAPAKKQTPYVSPEVAAGAASQRTEAEVRVALSGPQAALPKTAWKLVCNMEEPLAEVSDLVSVFHFMATHEDTQSQESKILSAVANAMDGHLNLLEEQRGQLFQMLHPDRERLDREGWPKVREARREAD